MLSADDPINGEIGFSIWKVVGKTEDARNPMIPVAPKATIIDVESQEDFDTIFRDAWDKNFPITPCDDPVKLVLGFIVTRRTERVLYRIPLNKYQGNNG